MKVYAMSEIHGYLKEFENALSNVDLMVFQSLSFPTIRKSKVKSKLTSW